MIRLANTPMPHVPHVAPSVLDLFRSKGSLNNMHRHIPAPEPNPEPNPAPDAVLALAHSCISPLDWDQLFNAITTRLESCVAGLADSGSGLEHLPGSQASIQATVLECVTALNQLQSDLIYQRTAHACDAPHSA
ncbi:MAG: hypothetical protein WBK51_04365 [Polaromonas sp.]